MTTPPRPVTSGKGGWIGAGAPGTPHFASTHLKVAQDAARAFVRQRINGERGDTVIEGSLALTVAKSNATGTVTFTLAQVLEAIDWSDLTWNVPPTVSSTVTATATIDDPAHLDVVLFDDPDFIALAQRALAGRNYGWEITSDSGDVVTFYGFGTEHPPALLANAVARPAAPTDLNLAGTGTLSNPTAQWSSDDQVRYQLQLSEPADPAVDGDGTFTAPTFDTGEIADLDTELPLSATAYPGVDVDGGFTVHVRVKNTPGGPWSEWSDSVRYTRGTKDAVTVNNPTGGEVDDQQPVFSASCPGALGWRMRLIDKARPNRAIATSDWSGPADDFEWQAQARKVHGITQPLVLQATSDYRLIIEAIPPGDDWIASPGDPANIRVVTDFVVNQTGAVATPVLVSVTEDPNFPQLVATVTCDTSPTQLILEDNGKAVLHVDADEVHTVGTTYVVPYPLATPMRAHSLRVRAREAGIGVSARSNAVSGSYVPAGLWFISADRTRWVVIHGDQVGSWAREDKFTLFKVQDRDGTIRLVRIREGLGKFAFSHKGDIRGDDARTAEQYLDDLEAMWADGEPVTCVVTNWVGQVLIDNYVPSPSQQSWEGNEWAVADVACHEVG